MHAMERSEPSLAPQWLRSNGCGSSIHQFASSQADGSDLAFPLSRSLKSVSNSDSSPLLDRTSSSDSRRSTISNGFNKFDRDSYARSYSSFSKTHRNRGRERLTTVRSRDSEYSDPLKGMINGRAEDPSRRSQSLISGRLSDPPRLKIPADMRNGIHKTHDSGIYTVGGNGTGIRKVSFEREFPVLGSEERPKTPDVIRVSSPGLNRGTQSFATGTPPLVGSEGWTSALVEFPPASSSCASSVSSSSSSGLNMAEALAQASAQSLNAPQPSIQSLKDEVALAQSKKLIPVTSLLNKTMVLSASDKSNLKTKTIMRPSETAVTPKNGVHLQPLLVGSQPIREDGPKSPSGKLLLLKPGRENGVFPGLKDLQIPTTNVNIRVANGQSTDSPTASSGPLKNSHNTKILHGPVIDKRTSRSNFFKLMREKSVNNTPGPISGASASLDVVDKLDKEPTELGSVETGNELKCNRETHNLAPTPSVKISHEEEKAFLISLGWEDKVEDGEEGLTKEEIDAFCKKVIEQGATSRLCRLLQAKLLLHVLPMN